MSYQPLSHRAALVAVAVAMLAFAGAASAQDDAADAPAEQASPAAQGFDVSDAHRRFPVTVSVQRWFTPATAGTSAYDWGFSRPTTMLALEGWRNDWGARVGATIFGVTSIAGQSTPYIAGGGFMGDLQARWRGAKGADHRLSLDLGARVLNFRNVGYLTVGLDYAQPLLPWLDLDLDAMAGTNVNLAYVLDGSLALRAHRDRWGLSAGFRALDLQCGCVPPEPALGIAAPFVAVDATF